MAKLTTAEFIEAIKELSVLELNELVKACEEEFGVSAAGGVVVAAGVVEGTYYDAKGIEMIATIPSRDELIAKFMGSIQSPIANFARVIKQIAEKQGGDAPAEEAAAE